MPVTGRHGRQPEDKEGGGRGHRGCMAASRRVIRGWQWRQESGEIRRDGG